MEIVPQEFEVNLTDKTNFCISQEEHDAFFDEINTGNWHTFVDTSGRPKAVNINHIVSISMIIKN